MLGSLSSASAIVGGPKAMAIMRRRSVIPVER
jgi:hypothetical protein